MLSELSTLFKGFGKLAPGAVGKRTLDPTALRLALASLDPKRFAAGRASITETLASHSLMQKTPSIVLPFWCHRLAESQASGW